MKALLYSLLASAIAIGALRADLKSEVRRSIESDSGYLQELYRHLHANPELSFMEERTASRLAAELRQLGLEVTEKVGRTGLVAVLRNGDGPTVLVRADMDALPVKEETGLAFASQQTALKNGVEYPVMHACAHDVHMTAWVGTARQLARLKDRWSGTLVLIAQPAEELGSGALAMLKDGLFKNFPKPEAALALHVSTSLPSGTVGFTEGYALANVEDVDITIHGEGGHGAFPHTTRDPIVLAAQTVLALQTIVSREVKPGEAAVLTVGSIHGGTKNNIIPDEVKLQLTLRSYTDETRDKLIGSIRRITAGLAQAAGLPPEKFPTFSFPDDFTPATYNNPELARRVSGAFRAWLGEEKVLPFPAVMGGEDFGQYGRTEEKIPIFIYWVGGVNPETFAAAQAEGTTLPSLHSSHFVPDAERTINTGVTAMTAAVLELTGN